MKYFIIILSVLTGMNAAAQQPDLLQQDLKQQAALAFKTQALPASGDTWPQHRAELYRNILQQTGAVIDHALPPDYRETGHVQMKGYSIRNIYFQARPGVYATANLYVPEGKGPFPAVVVTHGHWQDGRRSELFQSVAHLLAMNGYVCLNIDAWGAGERTTVHGEHEYHGSNLGASLMDIGTSLMGMQLTDNIRAVDLLCSLPYVDTAHIGATGASGGGNQAMWLAAMDERITAAVPVVSVGTFESYIMNSNCVCELLPGGLCFTEEAGVLGMVAPRALKMLNALNDANKAFTPAEMLRSYAGAERVYDWMNASDKLSYQLFNTGHGYWPEMQEAMLGWFELHLKGKGTGAPKKAVPVTLLPPEKLMTFAVGKRRDTLVAGTAAYCRQQGILLRSRMKMDDGKKGSLKKLLRLHEEAGIEKVVQYGAENGWERMMIQTADRELIPVWHRAPEGNTKEYTIIIGKDARQVMDSLGRDAQQTAAGIGDQQRAQVTYSGTSGKGQKKHASTSGILIPDLWGTGGHSSPTANAIDGQLPPFHTLSRSLLWLGETVMGKWVSDLQTVHNWLVHTKHAGNIRIDATKEAGLAAIFHAALYNNTADITLHGSPVSYLFDERNGADHFNMAVHIPGILQWGDISMAAGLSSSNITFIDPVSVSGRKITGKELEQYKKEFEQMKKAGAVRFR